MVDSHDFRGRLKLIHSLDVISTGLSRHFDYPFAISTMSWGLLVDNMAMCHVPNKSLVFLQHRPQESCVLGNRDS